MKYMHQLLGFTALGAIIMGAPASAQNPLMIPDTLTGRHITLTLQQGTYTFYPGYATQTMGANGPILGPTLILYKGDSVYFNVVNQLPDTTTIHWHGMHVSAANDGGPHTVIPPGTTWTPAFEVLDDAATYWYHPHLHKKTNLHVTKGIAGFIIVRDSQEASLPLPRTYGVDDIPLVIQTKAFDNNKQIIVPTNSDSVVMVNATINPEVTLPAQVVRLRLLNGSSMRVFNIGFSENLTFHQIASDGGLLSSPVSLTRLWLAPGERAEILLDLSGRNGQTVYLKSYASELPNGIYGAANPGMMPMMTLNGYNPSPINGTDFNILKINVGPPTSNPITSIPSTLRTVTPIPASQANVTRTLRMRPTQMGPNQLNGDFTFNNAPFNMNVINYTIPLNSTEIWEIINNSAIAHPFHIHDVQFYVLDRDGNPPPLNERGKKDVILVRPGETVRFITQFTDFADDSIPYMYHCHMLFHEDRGMMGQFIVTAPSTGGIGARDAAPSFVVFPNPSRDVFHIAGVRRNAQVNVYTADGKQVLSRRMDSDHATLNLPPTLRGTLWVEVVDPSGTVSRRRVVRY